MIKFRRDYNSFQKKVNKDIEEITSSNCIWVRADKSKNMYKIKPSKYHEFLRNKITDNYKTDYNDTIDQINNDTCKFASKLHIEDKLGKFKKEDA